MAIIFENIDTKETVAIDRERGGKFYHAKLSAAMNSSNMNPNADRGQDKGWRVQPEQQAIIEEMEQDADTIDKVSIFTKVPTDALSHAEFLSYLLHQQELGKSPERSEVAARRENQLEYEARVESIKAQARPEVVPAFDYDKATTEESELESFMNGDMTGDDSGDKVEEKEAEDTSKTTPKENAKAVSDVKKPSAKSVKK